MNENPSFTPSDHVPLLRLESNWLTIDVAPDVGGRIVSLIHKPTGHEFLWRNAAVPLIRLAPGTEYDPHFYGGIDELLPNDIPEQIDGVPCPDHGELWTTKLSTETSSDRVCLRGILPQFGLEYVREMRLAADAPVVELTYRLTNRTQQTRHFLWKLHAALAIAAGDVIHCPAQQARVVDLAWSRYRTLDPFPWPHLDGQRTDVIPVADGTVDFFYLYQLSAGRMAWERPSQGLRFEYRFDTRVFPYAWLFASYGGFDGHYTAVLEPCTSMPISVPEAASLGQCAVLRAGESLGTSVSIYAGVTPTH